MSLQPVDNSANSKAQISEIPVLSHILTPGSSLNPTFLLIVDTAFALLILLLITLAFVTRSPHFFALIVISVGLWGSVKWFVNELRQTPLQKENSHTDIQESKKDN